jgi:hypothetical protein
MPIYEIINPSDACTIEAPDDKTAIAAVTLLSSGAYGLRAEDGRNVCGLSLFGIAEQVVEAFLPDRKAENLMEATVGAMMAWVKENKKAVIDTLDSFVYGDAAERAFLVEAMAQAKDPAKVKAAHEDRRRTSMNNIGAAASAYAAHLREGD